MSEPNYEAVGRYHFALKDLKQAVIDRNEVLDRFGMVAKNASRTEQIPRDCVGRRCNFSALQNLLNEAQAKEQQMQDLLLLVNDLAPIANMPEVKLG